MMDRWFNPHSVHSLQAMIGECQPASVCAFHIDQWEKRKSAAELADLLLLTEK